MASGYLLNTLGGWKACCDGCADLITRHHSEGSSPLSRVDFSPYSQSCLFCGREISQAVAPFRAEFTDVVGRHVEQQHESRA